jgi:hypothetical protein
MVQVQNYHSELGIRMLPKTLTLGGEEIDTLLENSSFNNLKYCFIFILGLLYSYYYYYYLKEMFLNSIINLLSLIIFK